MRDKNFLTSAKIGTLGREGELLSEMRQCFSSRPRANASIRFPGGLFRLVSAVMRSPTRGTELDTFRHRTKPEGILKNANTPNDCRLGAGPGAPRHAERGPRLWRHLLCDAATGDDLLNDGLSSTTPWKTITNGVFHAGGGDTIMVNPGTYLESVESKRDGFS
jgi:Protein of unknown function (DUF1565)